MCMSGFSLLKNYGPHNSQKIQLFSPPVKFPHHNLITYPGFSITKVKTILYPIFLSLPVKTLPQVKFPTLFKCQVTQLLLTLFRWLHVNEYIMQFTKLQ